MAVNKTARYRVTVPVGMIGIILIVLKLAGVIDWAWWIVTLPIWLTLAFIFTIWAAFVAYGILIVLLTVFFDSRRW